MNERGGSATPRLAWGTVRRVKMLRYLVAAGAGAATDFVLFALLVYAADIHYLWAGVGSFMVSTLANYLVSVRLVFRSGTRFPRPLELTVVYAVSATGLCWHQLILFAAIEWLDMHVLVAKLVATGLVFFWNYFVRRNFVFAARRS